MNESILISYSKWDGGNTGEQFVTQITGFNGLTNLYHPESKNPNLKIGVC